MSNRGQPAAPTLDRYMRESYDVVRTVYENLHSIRAIASHLTPVEDLVEFQNEVTHLYAHLSLLVEASQIIVRITDAGYDMMTAEDVAAQRNLLELGSAALRPEEYFATAEDFNNLRDAFQSLSGRVAAIEALLDTFATKDELDQLRNDFNDRVQDLEDRVGFIIEDELEVIIGDETFTGLAKALEYLYAKVTEVEGGLIAQAGKIVDIESSITNMDGTISGLSTAYNELSTEVSYIDGNMSTLSQQITHLTGSVINLDHDVAGLGDAFSLLNTTVVQQGEDILVQSQRTDSLSAQVTNMADEVSGYSGAISNLISRAEILEGSVDVLSAQQTQLGVRITDAETGLVSQAEATENLEIRVTQNEEGTTILGEDVTRLRGAIHSPGNILPNAGLESSTYGWRIHYKGNGWTTAQLVHNLDVENALPPGLNALGIQVSGVPSGDMGVRSPRFPVEELKHYVVSAYLIAENCDLTLEWRTFDGEGNELDFGVVGEAENPPGLDKIADLDRVFTKVPINLDTAQMELQLWVTNAHTASPRAWLTRPMVEEVNVMQEEPSPWVPSSAGIDLMYAEATQGIRIDIQELEDSQSALSQAFTDLEAAIGDLDTEAIQQLTAQVQQNKDDILAASQSLTSLSSRTGSLYEWRAVIHETGASNQSQLFPASSDTAAVTFGSGMNLLRFNTDGTLQSAVNYPTIATQGRTDFVNAMNALNQEDFFVLAGVPSMGTRTQAVIDAVERNGGFRFKDLLPSRPYLLLGGGDIGKGAGVEVIARSNQGIDHSFTLVRGVPKGLHESYALATAYSEMETQVLQNANGLTALSQDMTALESEIEDKVSTSAFNTLSTQVSDIDGEVSGISSWQQSLSARIPSGSGELATDARVTSVETASVNRDNALASTLATVQATADNAATKAELTSAQNALAAADQALSERIDLTQASIGGVVTVANPSFESDTGWGSSPGSDTLPAGAQYRWSQLGSRRSGNYSMALTAGTILYNSRIIATQAGDVFYLAAWARSYAAEVPNAGSEARIGMRAYGADGEFISGSQQLFVVAVSPGSNFDWTYGGGEYTVPDTAVGVSVYLAASTSTGAGTWLIDDVTIDRVTQTDRALASLLNSTRADVQQNTTGISAAGARLDTLEVEVPKKASVSYVNEVEGRVETYADNAAAANLSLIQGLEADVEGNTAAVNQVMEVTSSLSGVGLVANPSFEEDGGWDLPAGVDMTTVAAPRTGTHTLRFMPGYPALRVVGNTARTPVQAGQTVRVLAHIRKGGGTLSAASQFSVCIRWRDASGTNLGRSIVSISGAQLSGPFGPPLVVTAEPFEGAVYANAELQAVDHEAGAAAVYVDDVALEIVSDALAEVRARYSLAVTAGGDVAGMQLLAGGGTSAIRFLANSVDVVDPGGASGWSLVGGIATWRKGSHMVVIGPGFGANNEFMYWSGPIQSNLANCRRNNAIRYETVTGESFQRGGIIAGTRVHSGFNPALSVPSIYTTPSLGTGGNPISVNASVGYFRQIRGSTIDAVFVPGSGSNTATLQLWRKIGSGAWQMVASQTFTGFMLVNNDPETFSTVMWNITGAITYTDTAGGTQNRQYEARLVTRLTQGVSTQNPAHGSTPMDESQSVGIVTEEDP